MPPTGSGRPYKNGSRYWGNFERFADVGGKREPLVPPGEKLATDDEEIALHLYTERLKHYRELKRDRLLIGRGPDVLPATYAVKEYLPHLEQRRRNKRRLRADQELPKKDREALKKTHHAILTCLKQPSFRGISGLGQIDTSHITTLVKDLQTVARTRRGTPMSPDTVRRLLMELSGMFERARFQRFMKENPINGHPEVPSPRRGSALDANGFLTRAEVAALLENVLPSAKSPWAVEQAYVLYYTGCRLEELNGLLVDDFDFQGQNVHFVENEARGFKTPAGRRQTPFWPRLQAVMKESFTRTPRPSGGLAFPRPGATADMALEQQKMTRLRGSLRSAGVRAKINKKIGHHIARHSYISARIQMFETDALGRHLAVEYPVIAAEVGHATGRMIETTYGHLTKERVRQDLLDYGDTMPNFEERIKRGKRLAGDQVKAGIHKAKERAKPKQSARSARKEAKRPAKKAGRFSSRSRAD